MKTKTIHEIHTEDMDALLKSLNPDDTIRFLHIYEQGSGDWTKDRKKYLEKDPEKLIQQIMKRRKNVPVP